MSCFGCLVSYYPECIAKGLGPAIGIPAECDLFSNREALKSLCLRVNRAFCNVASRLLRGRFGRLRVGVSAPLLGKHARKGHVRCPCRAIGSPWRTQVLPRSGNKKVLAPQSRGSFGRMSRHVKVGFRDRRTPLDGLDFAHASSGCAPDAAL